MDKRNYFTVFNLWSWMPLAYKALFSFQSSLRFFAIGWLVQTVLRLVRVLGGIFRKPRGLWEALKHKDNIYLGLFLGCFSGSMKVNTGSSTSVYMYWKMHSRVIRWIKSWNLTLYPDEIYVHGYRCLLLHVYLVIYLFHFDRVFISAQVCNRTMWGELWLYII